MKKRYVIPLAIVGASALLTLLARCIRPFADFYCAHIFPYISAPLTFLSGLVPFSAGEVLIVAALLLIFIGIPLMIILLIFRKNSRRKTAAVSMTIALWCLAYVSLTETLNCFMLYGCTRFSQRYFTAADHKPSQLVELYGMLIEEANDLALQVPRDRDDRFELTIDPDKAAIDAMKAISGDYPQLSGYYPDPKPIQFSFFMSQSNLLGMYFPFTMEANYNDDMVRTNLPDTLCHELAHLKGFIQEDEANFIAYIATSRSSDPQVRYSGCLRALEYVRNQIVRSGVSESLTDSISEQVRRDWFRFMPDTYWEDNKKKEIIPTETVEAVSDAATDTSLKLNGVEEGIERYTGVVALLLDYYFPGG